MILQQAPQRRPFQPYRWAGRQLCQVIRTTNQTVSMTLLLVPLLIMFTFAAVHAATSYTVTNDSQCITFLSAIGATGDPTSAQCYVYQGTLPAGDTLTLTDGWSLRPQGTGAFPGTNFINRGTITGALYNAGTFENRGVITLTDTGNNRSGGLINNYGTMVVDAPLIHTGTINNQGTIIVTCNGRINSTGGTITGNTIQEQGNCDYPVANDSQCTAFLSAIGATGQPTSAQCYVYQGTLPAGDTLTLTGGWSLRPQSTGAFPGTNFINYGTITGALYNAGTFENRGVITLTDTGSNRTGGVIDNYGTMVVDAPLIHTGTINNQGTLMVTCNGTINSTGTITGNPLINLCETIRPRANPTPNPPANGNGWHNSDVTVLWNWTDNAGGSGIDAANCVATSSSSSEGIQILSATCTDLAGNTGNATYQVRIDKSRPTVNPAPNPPANANGWSNRDVTVAWNWFDNGSGVDPATCPPTTLVTGEGRTTLDQICFDRAGNEMRSLYTVNLDKTLPTANPTQSPPANANGWNNSDVTVTWNWRDPAPGSGQAAGLDPTNCPLTTTSSGEGNPQLNGQCRDLADNRTEQNYTVLVDKTAPVVTITGVSNGAVYTLGSVPTAACNTTDTRSGVATQATLSVTGGNPDGTGNFTATCSGATDLAGNSGSASVIYTVNAPSTPTSTSTSLPTPTNTPEPTATPSSTSSPTPTPTEPAEATPEPTATPSSTSSPTPTNTPEPTATPGGTLIGGCGPYTVYQNGTTYRAVGWAGTILVGTNGNNTLNGSSGADLILGLGGNDLLKGNGGDDVLCGGDGVDLLLGADGNDYLDGGSGNDVLNGGTGDYDVLIGSDGNDVLLDGDGVSSASGGAGNDIFTIALRNGWRDGSGQPRFTALTAGYGNDIVGLAMLDRSRFFVDITGDERDNPPSTQEGTNDSLALAGLLDPTSSIIKFERRLVLSADAAGSIPSEEAGAEYLTEPVGEETQAQTNYLFLPLVSR